MLEEKSNNLQDQSPGTSLGFYCDACGFCPIKTVPGHFICPAGQRQTPCCEGAPTDE